MLRSNISEPAFFVLLSKFDNSSAVNSVSESGKSGPVQRSLMFFLHHISKASTFSVVMSVLEDLFSSPSTKSIQFSTILSSSTSKI